MQAKVQLSLTYEPPPSAKGTEEGGAEGEEELEEEMEEPGEPGKPGAKRLGNCNDYNHGCFHSFLRPWVLPSYF